MHRISTLILFSITFVQAHAQDTLRNDSTLLMKEVVIYQAVNNTPITFQNITGQELKKRSTGQEPSFLLAETPSITAYSDAGNTQGYSYFRLRGIDQTRINTTLDGVPLNEPEDQGAYFSNYPDILNSVSSIQIQRGIGTSKNGVAGYGGSIQLSSPNLQDSAKTTFGIGYGSYNSSRLFGEFNSGVKNKKALYVRASQIHSDGYKYHSANTSQSVFISGGLFFKKTTWHINIVGGHQQNQLAWLGVPDSLIVKDRRTNVNKNENDQFAQCLFHLQNRWKLTGNSFVQSSIYYTYLKGNYDFNLNAFLGLPSTNELYNYAFQSDLIGFFSNYTLATNRLDWTTGIQGNTYARKHTGSDNLIGQLYTNTGYKNEISAFTKATYTIRRFIFFADVQYRYASFEYKGQVSMETIQWHFINPKAGISVVLKPNTTAYYSIGQTGREPTRNDMFGGNDDLISDSLGNAVLSIKAAEYVLNQELGIRCKTGKTTFSMNAYYMDFKNEIVLNGQYGPNGLALTNHVAKSFRTGLEFSATYSINKHITLINHSSLNYSRIKEQGEIFSPILTPPFIINQEAIYSYKAFSISVSARYQGKSFIDFANTSLINEYFLLNSRVQYDFHTFQFSVFVNNITNSKYFSNGYVDADGTNKYFVQSLTNMYLSAKYSF